MRRSRFLAELARTVSWHRRKLAVVAAVAAVLTAVNAASPPAPPSTPTVVTTVGLAAGAIVDANDLSVRDLPRSVLPDGASSSIAELVGRTLVAAVPANTVLTPLSVLTGRESQSPGTVIAPIQLNDAAVVALLRPGDRIDLVAADSRSGAFSVAVRDARVVTVPQSPGNGSLTAAAPAGGDGQLVLVAVTESEATTLAQAASAGQLSAILH